MNLTLQIAADFIRTARGPTTLLTILRRFRTIFSFTDERKNRLSRYVKIARAYKAGKPVRDIETEYGCSRHTVLRYARMADLPKRPKHFPEEIRRGVIAMYQQKKPIAEIAARFGVSQAYVSKTATEEGINRRNFNR